MARQYLTIQEKNQLRAWHRQHPELTQAQLCEWVHAELGKWVGHSTVGQITRRPEQHCANPTAKRQQRGRYPEVEQKLYEFILATSKAQHPERSEDGSGDVASIVDMTLPELRDTALWAKANDILKCVRSSDQSVSVAWVQRFKWRHGLHSKQLRLRRNEGASGGQGPQPPPPVELETGVLGSDQSQSGRVAKRPASISSQDGQLGGANENEIAPPPAKRPAIDADSTGVATTATRPGKSRKHFMPAEDIMLLRETLKTEPWAFPQTMAGWHEVATNLRASGMDKTGGACQTRMMLLLKKLRAGDTMSQRKSSSTVEEHQSKLTLLSQVQTAMATHREAAGALSTQLSAQRSSSRTSSERGTELLTSRENDQGTQSRLDRIEREMLLELATQRLHAQQQAEKMEKLHRAQMEAQQTQHAQLLATIQQQQSTMINLINAVTGTGGPVHLPLPTVRDPSQQDDSGEV